MLLSETEAKRRKRKKLFIFFLTSIVMLSVLAVSAGAWDIRDPDPAYGESVPDYFIIGDLYRFFRQTLYYLIVGVLQGAFSFVNMGADAVGDELGTTPSAYNTDVFDFIDTVSRNVIIPIATVLLAYVVIYELITMLMEKNNFHDFDTSIFFRWIVKTGIALLFLTNAQTIVNAFFDLGSVMVNNLSSAANGFSAELKVDGLAEALQDYGLGTYVSLLIPVGLLNVVSIIIYVCVYIILIGRMIEIYIYLSVAPIPFATVVSHEVGDMGKNYIRTIFAFVLQAFFIFLCVCVYKVLVMTVADDIANLDVGNNATMTICSAVFKVIAYGVVLVLTMFKTNGIAKSITGAH